MSAFHVYILLCADGTLYCGSTSNIERRMRQHNGTKAGAHYTKIRRPVILQYAEGVKTLREARSREAAIKRLTRREKCTLVEKGSKKRDSIFVLSIVKKNMGKGDNSQRKEKKKPKKEKKK